MKKSIRINNSVIELKDGIVKVYRKGELVKVCETGACEELVRLQEVCAEETMFYINK